RRLLEDDTLRGRRPPDAHVPQERTPARPAVTIRAVLFDVGGPIATEVEHERAIDADIRALFAEQNMPISDAQYAAAWGEVIDEFAPNAYSAVIYKVAAGDEEIAPSVW